MQLYSVSSYQQFFDMMMMSALVIFLHIVSLISYLLAKYDLGNNAMRLTICIMKTRPEI